MNVFSFTGNLGKDCEVKQAGNSTVCEFSVAVKSGYGEREKTNWVRCKLWGKRAEGGLPPYLVKGQQVAISGEYSLSEWEKDGEKHSIAEVNVNSVDLVGGKADGDQAGSNSSPAPASNAGDDFSDDIPFDIHERNFIA